MDQSLWAAMMLIMSRYDDTYRRNFWAPGSGCKGPAGAETVYDESIDYNSTELFSGGINPANLPLALVNGKCTEIYPHMALRVNTAFEVVVEAGKQTAYSDKHPAYDLVRGPSGTGLTAGYFPEQASVSSTDIQGNINYDKLRTAAFVSWIQKKNPQHTEGGVTEIPALFGGNYQAVSVAQKNAGYTSDLKFTPALLGAIDFVDAAFGEIVSALKAAGVYEKTLLILSPKHGQSPINRKLLTKIDPKAVTNATGVPVAFQTSDDVALIFLEKHSDLNTAVKNLESKKAELHIDTLIYGEAQKKQGFGDPTKDPAVPDIIVRSKTGVIYTTNTVKVAEHGGLNPDDRHVALFASNPYLKPKSFDNHVSTQAVAPTILAALGLDPFKLQAVRKLAVELMHGF